MALPDGSHRPVHVNSFIDPQKGVHGGTAAAGVSAARRLDGANTCGCILAWAACLPW